MNREIYNLFAYNKPLPKNALLRGEPISPIALESANKCPNHMSECVPFWVLGWRDLHDDLSVPANDSGQERRAPDSSDEGGTLSRRSL